MYGSKIKFEVAANLGDDEIESVEAFVVMLQSMIASAKKERDARAELLGKKRKVAPKKNMRIVLGKDENVCSENIE
jgi:hypothetical protein